MKMKSRFQQSEEAAAIKDFVARYFCRDEGLAVYERMYQLSQRIAFKGSSEQCVRLIKKLLKGFIDRVSREFSAVEHHDVGECLYGFEEYWSESKDLFGKIFLPVASRETGVDRAFGKVFSRLFNRLVDRIAEGVCIFLTSSIKEDLEGGVGTRVCGKAREEASAPGDLSNSSKKPRMEEGDNKGVRLIDVFGSSKFGGLSQGGRIVALMDMLRRLDSFDVFFKRVVGCVVSVYKSEIEGRRLSLASTREFVDKQRKMGHMGENFYMVESCLMREITEGFGDSDVFRMFGNREEARICLDFFRIGKREERFMEITKRYHEKVCECMCVENFVVVYYLLYHRFRVFGNSGSEGDRDVEEGICECRRRVVNEDRGRAIEGVSQWIDRVFRGEMSIGEAMTTGDGGVRLPGGEVVCGIDMERVLENIGVEGVMMGGEVWGEYFLSDVLNVIREVFYFCDEKERFECVLQKRLGDRLLSQSCVSLDWEQRLANSIDVGNVRNHRMRSMLRDFGERKTFGDSEILFLRMYKWPEYKDVEIRIPEVSEIQREYENKVLKSQRKRVRWMGILSSCDVDILGVPVTITLVQYVLVKLLSSGPRETESLVECEAWGIHLEMLVRNRLVLLEDRTYSLNMGWRAEDITTPFIPKSFLVEDLPRVSKSFDETESLRNLLDCRIMRAMKTNRVLSRARVRECVGMECPEEMFDEEVSRLISREFLVAEGGNLRYMP